MTVGELVAAFMIGAAAGCLIVSTVCAVHLIRWTRR